MKLINLRRSYLGRTDTRRAEDVIFDMPSSKGAKSAGKGYRRPNFGPSEFIFCCNPRGVQLLLIIHCFKVGGVHGMHLFWRKKCSYTPKYRHRGAKSARIPLNIRSQGPKMGHGMHLFQMDPPPPAPAAVLKRSMVQYTLWL